MFLINDILNFIDSSLKENIVIKSKIFLNVFDTKYLNNFSNFFYYLFKSNLSYEDIIFLDLETNGLYGCGNFPFLYGVGIKSDNNFIILQIILKKFGIEKEILEIFKKLLNDKKVIVTFNGNRFDIQVLKERSILNRNYELINYIENIFKFDLYLFLKILLKDNIKKNINNCLSLKNIEKYLLKINRINDIDSSLVPYLFKNFIENNYDDKYIFPIINHNFADIYSLFKLFNFFENEIFNKNYFDIFKYIKYLINKKEYEKATLLLNNIPIKDEVSKINYFNIKILKKKKEFESLKNFFEELNEEIILSSYLLIEEYFKFYEFYIKDFSKIILFIEKNIKKLNLLYEDKLEEIIKRYERVKKKLFIKRNMKRL